MPLEPGGTQAPEEGTEQGAAPGQEEETTAGPAAGLPTQHGASTGGRVWPTSKLANSMLRRHKNMLKSRKVPILDEKTGSGLNSVKLLILSCNLPKKCLPVVLVLFPRLQWPGSPCEHATHGLVVSVSWEEVRRRAAGTAAAAAPARPREQRAAPAYHGGSCATPAP